MTTDKARKQPAPDEVREALCKRIGLSLDRVMQTATGALNGYGIDPSKAEQLRDALAGIRDDLATTPFILVRPEILDELRQQIRHREMARSETPDEHAAFRNFFYEIKPRPGWKGNAKLRTEVETLYKGSK